MEQTDAVELMAYHYASQLRAVAPVQQPAPTRERRTNVKLVNTAGLSPEARANAQQFIDDYAEQTHLQRWAKETGSDPDALRWFAAQQRKQGG